MESFIMAGSYILATGSALPDVSITNKYLCESIDSSDQWIFSRTGIKERRLLNTGKSIIDLAFIASKQALNNACMDPKDIDLIILATSSPNDLFGSASQLQAKIGAFNAAAFDITAACSGFVIALITASQFIQSGSYRNILVVGADVLSRWVDWSDRNTCILFGDGAGAVILQKSIVNCILGFQLDTDGLNYHQLSLSYQSEYPLEDKLKVLNLHKQHYNYLSMNGKEVYKFAVSKVPESIKKCLTQLNLTTEDIDWLLLHQANQRILETIADKLTIPFYKVISNVKYYGNTSAASIPIALHETYVKGALKNGDIIVIAGFGAGLTWGTVVLKWQKI
jgi:3-oxoacyl-[acyl-carrier-protein] synthase III|uniref:Beta-ketoacyl-[acyl-carrier-protein] synthase III n=1 Tax=Thorea hispida TaxID=202687 RepID=A0A1C9CAL8_9FLOR|nr:3-oxoacyl-acyl-carrier-protein synthase 3 [Thorea hispida]AOM65414.1 3-oxoacyl-acyl-carrier-protein synthase 3 [Thorea hispida]UNJ79201.1 3-oxoacyl-acyl-carrier-protein synthase 3 [Thorea hispida]